MERAKNGFQWSARWWLRKVPVADGMSDMHGIALCHFAHSPPCGGGGGFCFTLLSDVFHYFPLFLFFIFTLSHASCRFKSHPAATMPDHIPVATRNMHSSTVLAAALNINLEYSAKALLSHPTLVAAAARKRHPRQTHLGQAATLIERENRWKIRILHVCTLNGH